MPRHVFKTIKFELCSTYGINLFKILCRTFHENNICVTFVQGEKEDKLTIFLSLFAYITGLYIHTSKRIFLFLVISDTSSTNGNVF